MPLLWLLHTHAFRNNMKLQYKCMATVSFEKSLKLLQSFRATCDKIYVMVIM